MKQKYWLCKRGSVYYSFDSATGKRESLQTTDKDEAKRILHGKNDALQHAAINISIAKAYLIGSDPKLVERTWRFVFDEFCSRGKESTRRRNVRAAQSKSFDLIRDKKLIETTADDFRAVMKAGGAFTNHYLRCLGRRLRMVAWTDHSTKTLAQGGETPKVSHHAVVRIFGHSSKGFRQSR